MMVLAMIKEDTEQKTPKCTLFQGSCQGSGVIETTGEYHYAMRKSKCYTKVDSLNHFFNANMLIL